MPKATIPIYHDDDFERLAELRLEVTIAERRYEAAKEQAEDSRAAPRRAGDDESDRAAEAKSALEAAQQAFNEFVDQASERAEMWVLKPIGHEEFRELLKAHPPRQIPKPTDLPAPGETVVVTGETVIHPDDAGWDVNTETFSKALLLYVDPDDDEHRTIIQPKFDTEAAMRKRVKRLSDGEFETMWITAHQANKGGVADPKLARF